MAHDGGGLPTLGHIAVYARDGRWRRSIAASLGQTGHSHHEAGTPDEMRRLLTAQRFDLIVLKLRDERDSADLNEALEGVDLPLHTIVLGSVRALPATLRRRRGGTFRYVPGSLPAKKVAHLVDLSISVGGWDENGPEGGTAPAFDELELEELIERAAAIVRPRAQRKRQRFNTVISGGTHVFGDPLKLRQLLAGILGLIVNIAPSGALINVEAQAGRDEWLVHVSATSAKRGQAFALVAEALREETKTLTAISRSLKEQGGMLWAELASPTRLALSLTLPLPPEAVRSASA